MRCAILDWMKVQGGSPGQIVSLEEAKERQHSQEASLRQKRLRLEATGWVRPAAPSPAGEEEGSPGEESTLQSLRRFQDWVATLKASRPSAKHLKASRAYSRRSQRGEKNQKGQRISRMA